MVRGELYVTVPSLFRCPISLDVMKSPVCLTTGVTYDRSSIQPWLDSGNNTCPATMQTLQSKEFVPNLTLRRLIQIWSSSAPKRADSVRVPVHPALTFDQARVLVREIEADRGNCSVDSLSKLVCFARESDGNRKFLAKIDGFVSVLVSLLSSVNGGDSKVCLLEETVKILHLLVINDCVVNKIDLANSMLRTDHDCLSSIVIVLQKGNSDSKTAALKVLESIAIDAESKLLIAGNDSLLHELLTFLEPETNSSTIENVESSLSCLIAITMQNRIKLKTVRLGIVKSLSKLLSKRDSTVSITEQALKLLEMVTSCTEGRSAISEDSACVAAITGKLMKVSSVATECSVMILWSICYLFRDASAQEAVAENNGLTKILLLMQSNCSPRAKQMSADLLKIFQVSSKSCLSGYDSNSAHIMPF